MIIKQYILAFIFLFSLSVMLLNPEIMISSVKNSLFICYNSIIPSLYIFMVFSIYFSQKDFMKIIAKPFNLYSHLIKIKDKKFSVYMLLSLFGGFAIGANFLRELKNDGYSKDALCVIAPAMINNSFSFCVYAIGVGLFNNFKLGIFLFFSLTISSLITSFILSFFYKYNIVSSTDNINKKPIPFNECISSSVKNILSVCGFVILFYYMCEVIILYSKKHAILSSIICIFTEVTTGCLKSAAILGKNPFIICFCLSILPISTICQVSYFTGEKFFIKSLLFSRLIHTPISIAILKLILNYFPVAINTSENISGNVKLFYSSIEISSTLFLLTLVFLIIFDSSKLFTKPQ